MNEKKQNEISKFMSLVLRHNPQKINITLDVQGWVSVELLLKQMGIFGKSISMKELEIVVDQNDKKRFAFNEDKTKIRASQGHSVNIDLAILPVEPPEFLYHGTVGKFLANIKTEGLKKINRQHVHLSKDEETATKVGNRRGNAIILIIRTREMFQDGYLFYCSENGVWLTDNVPSKYIDFK